MRSQLRSRALTGCSLPTIRRMKKYIRTYPIFVDDRRSGGSRYSVEADGERRRQIAAIMSLHDHRVVPDRQLASDRADRFARRLSRWRRAVRTISGATSD